jgi:hypothetical protein
MDGRITELVARLTALERERAEIVVEIKHSAIGRRVRPVIFASEGVLKLDSSKGGFRLFALHGMVDIIF